MRYAADTGLCSELERKKNLNVVLFLGNVVIWTIVLCNMLPHAEDYPVVYLFGLIAVVGFVSCIYDHIKCSRMLQNLQRTYLQIDNDRIFGMLCKDYKLEDNVEYFEFSRDSLRKIETRQINLKTGTLYNLYLHTTNGSFKLSISGCSDAVRTLHSLMNGNAANDKTPKPSHIWRCGNCGQMISEQPCPFCNE